jgi:hypothetical protein
VPWLSKIEFSDSLAFVWWEVQHPFVIDVHVGISKLSQGQEPRIFNRYLEVVVLVLLHYIRGSVSIPKVRYSFVGLVRDSTRMISCAILLTMRRRHDDTMKSPITIKVPKL